MKLKMNKNIYIYSQKLSLQVLAVLFIIIILIELLNYQIENYINFGLISLIASLILAYSSYKTINDERTKKIVKTLFFSSIIIITLSNFFFEALSKYHNVFYSILIGQIIVFPFMLREEMKNQKQETAKQKIFSKNQKTLLITITLIAILVLSFYLRMYNADIISPGRDSLHHYIAAKSINDNGGTVYETLPYINQMLAFTFENLEESLIFARLPFIIVGTLSVLLLYFIGRRISNTVGILSAILLGICPWAIGLSRYVRDYALNIFYELLLITILLYFPKSIKDKKNLIKYIFLNIIIYSTFVIFAKIQNGITLSIIIALFITTSVRIFIELDFYNKIKAFKITKKEVNWAFHAILLSVFIIILVLYVFEFYKRLTLTFQPKWLFFFVSESTVPMLWYSFMQVPWYFIVSLTLIPIIAKPKNKYVWISFLIFYAYLTFFVFIAKPHTDLLYARYIYPALPFFIILIAVTMSYIVKIPEVFSKNKMQKTVLLMIIILFLIGIFNIGNTLKGTQGLMDANKDERQVITVPYRDYTELLSVLEENGFSNQEITIASELRMKDTIAWYYDFDFYQGRTAQSFNKITYDIADNIYVLNESSIETIKKHESGWIIRRDGDKFPKSISDKSMEDVEPSEELKNLNINIEYLGKYSNKYEVYIWYENRSNEITNN